METKDKHRKNILPIILAGGLSTRFGKIGKYIPKFLFPIYGSSTLEEQISLLKKAGFKKMIISCRPEQALAIRQALIKKNIGAKITILPNAKHKEGPLSALVNLENKIKHSALIILSDIFFLGDPFDNLPVKIDDKKIYLLASRAKDKDYKEGGMISYSDKKSYTIVEKVNKKIGEKSFRWSGSVILSKNCIRRLKKILPKNENDKMGEYYDKLLQFGFMYSIIEITPFINMNTSKHLAQVLKQARKNNLHTH